MAETPQKVSMSVASSQTLTNSYVVGDDITARANAWISVYGEDVGSLTLVYTTGAAETNNSIEFKLEFSTDGTTWFQEQKSAESSGVNVLSAVEHRVAGAAAATAYYSLYNFQIVAKYMRVSFKETGVAANYGNVTCNITLGGGVGFTSSNINIGTISVDTEFPTAAAITDNFANPTTTSVMAMGMGWDGANWDRLSATAGVLNILDSNSAAALTALQLIDNPVAVLGTATYTETSTSGMVIGVVRNDTLAALANTDNEIAPLQVNALGALYTADNTLATNTTNIPNVIGTDGGAGPSMCLSVGGTNAGNIQELEVTADGEVHVYQDVAANLNCTEASAATIAGDTTSIDGKITACNTGAVVVASGAITETNSGTIASDTTDLTKALVGIVASPPTIDSYGQVAINLTTGANQVLVASAANKQIWVYGVVFTCGDADGQTVSFQDEDDVAITGIMELKQYGGMAFSPSGNFAMPIWKLGTDKDLEVDITGGDVDGSLMYAIVSV